MFIVFFALWLVLNGRLTLEIALFGVGLSAVMYLFLCKFFGYSIRKDFHMLRFAFRGVKYAVRLLGEIVIANLNVLKLVFSPKYEPEPALVWFKTGLKTDAARLIFANSITITPGTITVGLEGDEYCVHCLDKSFGEGLDDAALPTLLKKYEKL